MFDPNSIGDGLEAADFEEFRPLLRSIAYRMVGSVSEAEDIVQETFMRSQSADRDAIDSPRALLTTITTRLAIDHLRLARVRREEYVGAWLPEPVVDDAAIDPASHAELADSISMAFLMLLENLNPVERAVFLLREVFTFEYNEIAAIVQRSSQNCRQIASRARARVNAGKPRFEASRERRQELADSFLTACEAGDLEGLVDLLAADVVLYGDGGGKAPSVRAPVHGADRVARMLVNLGRVFGSAGARALRTTVNGQPGAIVVDAEGRVISVMTVDVADGQVQVVRSLVNPDKLRHLGEIADVWALLRGRRAE